MSDLIELHNLKFSSGLAGFVARFDYDFQSIHLVHKHFVVRIASFDAVQIEECLSTRSILMKSKSNLATKSSYGQARAQSQVILHSTSDECAVSFEFCSFCGQQVSDCIILCGRVCLPTARGKCCRVLAVV